MINRTLYRRISSHIVFKRPSEFLPHLFFSTIEEEGYDYNPSYNDDDVAPEKEPEIKVFKERRVDEFGRAYGTGRRKTSSARVWVFDGSGQITVNKRSFIDYFQPLQREHVLQAFHASKTAGQFDVYCTVKGGGQAGAVRLGISRALENFTPEMRPVLKKAGLLTRDSRRVERKKPGQKKARKKFQWVKR